MTVFKNDFISKLQFTSDRDDTTKYVPAFSKYEICGLVTK